MANTCKVCKSRKRKAIDLALVNGAALRDIAGRFGISKSALERHKADHIPAALAKAKRVHDSAHAENLLDRLEELIDEAHRLKDKAETWGDFGTAIRGVGELVRIIDLLGEMQGKLNRNPQINVTLSTEWAGLRAKILEALTPFPDARRAVAKVLNDGNPGA